MYSADANRYGNMQYRRCGNSGVLLPAISLGFWHNFGRITPEEQSRAIVRAAFDAGITHFDLANNYGPEPGAAEQRLGKFLHDELSSYRDELFIATKAAYDMWDGPYGSWASRKHLMASLDQSLKRMGLEYVDIFYHHIQDLKTPLEETMDALAGIVRSGKALYIGLSNYSPERLKEAAEILEKMGTRCLLHQHRYSMLARENKKLLPVIEEKQMGAIAFCPLEQGLLTDKYINGIPKDSRAAGNSIFLKADSITPEYVEKVKKLNEMAKDRGQSLAQMALAYALKDGKLTSVILGASRFSQIEENLKALNNLDFTEAEMTAIENILSSDFRV